MDEIGWRCGARPCEGGGNRDGGEDENRPAPLLAEGIEQRHEKRQEYKRKAEDDSRKQEDSVGGLAF